jgi:hypothetical protein
VGQESCKDVSIKALLVAVCTTFLVHCSYWPRQESQFPLYYFCPSFSKHNAVYTQKLTYYDSEIGGSMLHQQHCPYPHGVTTQEPNQHSVCMLLWIFMVTTLLIFISISYSLITWFHLFSFMFYTGSAHTNINAFASDLLFFPLSLLVI